MKCLPGRTQRESPDQHNCILPERAGRILKLFVLNFKGALKKRIHFRFSLNFREKKQFSRAFAKNAGFQKCKSSRKTNLTYDCCAGNRVDLKLETFAEIYEDQKTIKCENRQKMEISWWVQRYKQGTIRREESEEKEGLERKKIRRNMKHFKI